MLSIDDLMREIERVRDETARLRDLLRTHGILRKAASQEAALRPESGVSATPIVTKSSSMAEKAVLFLSLFQGRWDVYAHRWEGKNGRAGYKPSSFGKPVDSFMCCWAGRPTRK